MNAKNDSALVPRSPTAVEKAEPGAQRILSGMIADTLTLAKQRRAVKPIFTVLRSNDPIGEVYEAVIKMELESRYELRFISFATEAELLKLAREWPFDLAVLYLGNVSWMRTQGPLVDRAVEGLGRLRAQHGKPVIAMQGLDLAKRFEGTGVAFLIVPFKVQEFRRVLQACLNNSRNPTEQRGVMPFSRRTRPPRIVMMNDLRSVLDWLEHVVRLWFKDATILTFTDEESAYQELMREDPDLFTTDICHRGMSVDEVLARLTERRVKFPIFVVSATADRFEEKVRLSCGPELNVSFWSLPITVERFGQAIAAALQIPAQEAS
jgi:CheY-like chemotaxis protein